MTNTITDSAELEGTQASANAKGSGESEGQPSSEAVYITKAELEALLAAQADKFERALQSDKDRAVKRVEKQVEGLSTEIRPLLERAKQEGKTIDQLLSEVDQAEEVDFRTTIREVHSLLKEGKLPSTSSAKTSSGVDVNAVISDFGLDPTDRRVQDFASRSFHSVEQAEVAAARLLNQLRTSPNPTNADRPSQEAQPTKPLAQQDKLMKEFNEKAKELRGMALINLKMEYRKKGLDIS